MAACLLIESLQQMNNEMDKKARKVRKKETEKRKMMKEMRRKMEEKRKRTKMCERRDLNGWIFTLGGWGQSEKSKT